MTTPSEHAGSGGSVSRVAFVAFIALLFAGIPAAGLADADESHREMLSLFDEFLEWRSPPVRDDGLVDYSPSAIATRLDQLATFQDRLERIDRSGSDRAVEVDYLAARSHMDRDEFTLRVTQPWRRDPVFYVDQLQAIAFTELPAEGDDLQRLQRQLRSVPTLVRHAMSNLVDVSDDFAYRAVYNLSRSDGVGAGHPFRETPPEGTIGWYGDLLERARDRQPELAQDIEAARSAVITFHEWLEDNRDSFTSPNGVGEELLDWFFQNVEYLPYTSEEMLRLSYRELQRIRSFLVLERHSNRHLPEIELPKSREEYHERLRIADERIRSWIEREEIITLPDFLQRTWDQVSYIPWIERPEGPNFWEHVQFREPTPDHLTLVFPGHRFTPETRMQDELLKVRRELVGGNPIRALNFGFRSEGWKLYLEEMSIPAGLLDDEPRVRELIYTFSLWRAARSIGDIRNQRNEWTVPQTHEFWIDSTPWMDERVAHRYSYLQASPGHGVQYTIGAVEIYRLLSDMQHRLGDDFVLRDFHDTLISKGRLPVSLVRYELTGEDDEVAGFRQRTPLRQVLEARDNRR